MIAAGKSVHLAGTGSLNSNLGPIIARSGAVAVISANDGQKAEHENVARTIIYRFPDVGLNKVHVLERYVRSYCPDVVFQSIVATNESPEIDPYVERADLIISAANTVAGRRAIARKAVLLHKPIIDIGVTAKDHSQITVLLHSPQMSWGACCGCFFASGVSVPPDNGLSALDVILAAAFGAKLAIQYLTDSALILERGKNFWVITPLSGLSAMSVERRSDCEVCG